MKHVLSQEELMEAIRYYLISKNVIANTAGNARVNVKIVRGERASWFREPKLEIVTTFEFTPKV